MTKGRRIAQGLLGVVASSFVWIALGLVYFIVTVWIVSFGVETVTGTAASSDFVALSAALLSIGSLAGSSYSMGSMGSEPRREDPYETSEVA